MSFGFHRAEMLGALGSVLIIWALTAILVYTAIDRIIHPSGAARAARLLAGGICQRPRCRRGRQAHVRGGVRRTGWGLARAHTSQRC
jgi:hypothetical protein